METNKHTKLYKSGKLWVAATIATTAVAGGMVTTQRTAQADTVTPASQATNNQQVANAKQDVAMAQKNVDQATTQANAAKQANVEAQKNVEAAQSTVD
ncbi:KxYKxGKxW signal peptide domain-containing protein [Limosilactobacillus equigenerosi]|uniref:KxYKxGKxW signal peptide domain-containing protein n=1 Tax=Limosilactobacillus equigenerosi TaxID=417373 RepID=UPI0006D0882F|nr:KxYKxGKxW signal peptide domain-containing protein [Limosilactobacillus equigenerosi]